MRRVGTRLGGRPPRKQEPPSKPPNYTANDAGRAERFVDRFREDIRFVPEREIWLTWDAGRWSIDRDGALERLALHAEPRDAQRSWANPWR